MDFQSYKTKASPVRTVNCLHYCIKLRHIYLHDRGIEGLSMNTYFDSCI